MPFSLIVTASATLYCQQQRSNVTNVAKNLILCLKLNLASDNKIESLLRI